jgi:hypothetical protein
MIEKRFETFACETNSPRTGRNTHAQILHTSRSGTYLVTGPHMCLFISIYYRGQTKQLKESGAVKRHFAEVTRSDSIPKYHNNLKHALLFN